MNHRLAWHNPFSPKEIAKIPTEQTRETEIYSLVVEWHRLNVEVGANEKDNDSNTLGLLIG